MQVNSCFGGYIVFGYVDGVGIIFKVIIYSDYIEFWVKVLEELVKYIVYKGSIMVDGVSFIVNKVNGSEFMLWIIFYMLQEIVMCYYQVGICVNLEVDVIVCYLECLMFGDKVVEF